MSRKAKQWTLVKGAGSLEVLTFNDEDALRDEIKGLDDLSNAALFTGSQILFTIDREPVVRLGEKKTRKPRTLKPAKNGKQIRKAIEAKVAKEMDTA